MKSEKSFYKNRFSHVYVEHSVESHEKVEKIIKRLGTPVVVPINHYKDVFNKPSPDAVSQKHSQKLILAANKGFAVREGAPYCNDFGHKRFYYVSNVLNCPYECSYCYLKGKFPGANITAFVNTVDSMRELENKTNGQKTLVTMSYDSDELALEPILGLLAPWSGFMSKNSHLEFEIRTKGTVNPPFTPLPNITIAVSMLPSEVISVYEPMTPGLKSRLSYAHALIAKGFRTRICIDPVLEIEDYTAVYGNFIKRLDETLDISKVSDISVGSFRMPSDYYRRMVSSYGNHFLHYYPFEKREKQVRYTQSVESKLIDSVVKPLSMLIDIDRIYVR